MRVRSHSLMLCLLCVLLALLCGTSLPAAAQTTAPNEWTWVGGNNTGYENQVTGTRGTPAPGNIPAARYQATTWTDKNGNLWLFGGEGGVGAAGGIGVSQDLVLNDLWEFNPATQEWAWIAGSSTGLQPGVYGTMGKPAPGNVPGAREDASGWTDANGNLWLFGGYGLDGGGSVGILNDLWEFSPSTGEWTWMSGSWTVSGSSCFGYNNGAQNVWNCAPPSTYGTLGTPAAGNTPGGREAAITWTDKNGNLWLFGGWSYDVAEETQYYFNELWKYDPSINEWTWMGGSSTRDGSACLWNVNLWYYTCGEPGVYGENGTPDAGNIPGGRAGGTAWTDNQGNLWLFSGSGFDENGYFGDPNDLWKLDPSTAEWTWMGGNSAISPCADYDCSGPTVYGTLGTPAAGNIPQGRDHAVGWTDNSGNLWLFGGGGGETPDSILNEGMDDIWEFNPSTGEWALMGGSIESLCGIGCSSNPGGVYGGLGTPAPGEWPGNRYAPAGWTDAQGNFWLFGGLPGIRTLSKWVYFNDLWEYQPSSGPLPTVAEPTFSVPPGSYSTPQSVTLSDATDGAYIYFTTDGTTPTIDSPGTMPISVQHSETVKVMAVARGCLPSPVASATYTLPPQAATPTFSLPGGTYTSDQTVTISDGTAGATIYYTVDGSVPTTSSPVYGGAISIVNPYTPLQAIAAASDHSISNVASADYTLNLPNVSAPTFSLASGTYATAQVVSLSDATPGATIYYDFNAYPTTASPIYSGPITVSSPSTTIWAMATDTNYWPSYMVSAWYNVNPAAPQTATPAFSVPTGTYTAPQTVTISDATEGALIYYTTDGTPPTTSSTLYDGGPMTISTTETLEAIATFGGDLPSAVASATYTLPPNLSISGLAVSVVPGSTTSNTTTITLTPSGGFTGVVRLSCAITPVAASDPATCSIPASLTITGSAAQGVILTVNTTAPSSAMNGRGGLFGPIGGTAFACVLMVGIAGRRRKWLGALGMVLLLVFVGGALGCSGGGSGGGGDGGGGNAGTTPGSYTITVTGTSGSITETGTVALTVL